MKKTISTLLLLVLTQIVFGQTKAEKIDSLFTSLSKADQFNGNVLIAEKGNIIYKKSFGYANETTKRKLDENTVFELASCTKPFTAMAIMMLCEQGKLNLDDKITKYFPGLYPYENVKIINLLNHTGGIPDYITLMDSTWNKNKIATNQDVINTIIKYHPKELFEPNTKEEYSNTGYVLLASIIEKVSGQTYGDFLNSTIFEPLHMTRTFVYHRRLSPKEIKNFALGYLYIDNKYILPDNFDRTKFVIWLDGVEGDGMIKSTVNDLYKWDRALYTNKMLSKENMNKIYSNGRLNNGNLIKHGFGWRVLETKPFGKIARHSGAWPGYYNYIERDLDSNKTIIILQNHYNGVMPKQAIGNILYGMPLPQKMKQLYTKGKTVDEIIGLLENPVSKYLVDDFYEDGINQFGYQLTAQGKYKDALKIFRYNTMAYPESSNAFDSFGECLLKMGSKQQAKLAYEKSLKLDPKNKNAEKILSELGKEYNDANTPTLY